MSCRTCCVPLIRFAKKCCASAKRRIRADKPLAYGSSVVSPLIFVRVGPLPETLGSFDVILGRSRRRATAILCKTCCNREGVLANPPPYGATNDKQKAPIRSNGCRRTSSHHLHEHRWPHDWRFQYTPPSSFIGSEVWPRYVS